MLLWSVNQAVICVGVWGMSASGRCCNRVTISVGLATRDGAMPFYLKKKIDIF
jgi:hypothetical protein